ncbi:2'-5' RNA ligase family protein [Rubellicoccus peritrichatus]|uniref:2'-5' RNA ligase n=1 Tax=Rubellicoccus peritrichatus TaxID=3080537 RepID=A0AAQ3LA40_9BACT|nr:2'-5' RNA ligase family protein [Puniceicoccus sp. CR14]WOO42449.1 hypothetical protein RZN69_05055 [Puniceicoccus sp. CR14]
MKIDKPTYLIAELSGELSSFVSECRKQFNPERVHWPVDITIIGSSGVGTFREGQDLQLLVDSIAPVIRENCFDSVEFYSYGIFPDTGIYYFAPDRKNFDPLHSKVKSSGVLFNQNNWPYNPHCTVRAGDRPDCEIDALLDSITLPQKASIDCFSLYQPEPNGGTRIHRF